jgi:hypothetical protein
MVKGNLPSFYSFPVLPVEEDSFESPQTSDFSSVLFGFFQTFANQHFGK